MANNRLYIYDTHHNEYIMIAKALGDGWKLCVNECDIQMFFDHRDIIPSISGESTGLKLITEDQAPDLLQGERIYPKDD